MDDTYGDDDESTPPEITMNDLPADTLSLLRDHLSAQASDWPEKDGQEDYKLSQFWYTAGTAKALVDEVCEVNDCHRLSVCLSSSCRCGSVTAGSGYRRKGGHPKCSVPDASDQGLPSLLYIPRLLCLCRMEDLIKWAMGCAG